MDPLNVFGIGAEVCRVIDLVLEELDCQISYMIKISEGGRPTIPVTLLPMKLAG